MVLLLGCPGRRLARNNSVCIVICADGAVAGLSDVVVVVVLIKRVSEVRDFSYIISWNACMISDANHEV